MTILVLMMVATCVAAVLTAPDNRRKKQKDEKQEERITTKWLPVLLVLPLLASAPSQAACTSGTYSVNSNYGPYQYYGHCLACWVNPTNTGRPTCEGMCETACPSVKGTYSGLTSKYVAAGSWPYEVNGCSTSVNDQQISCYNTVTCTYSVKCDTQAEADSVACVSDGGQWTGTSCRVVADDTETMDKVKQQCQKLGGTPQFRYNEQGNVIGYCDICGQDEKGNYTSSVVQQIAEDLKRECCGRLGEFGDAILKCNPQEGGCFGADCDWAASGYNAYSLPQPNVCDLGAPLDPVTGLPAKCAEFADTTGSGGGDGPSSSSSGSESSSSGTGDPMVDGLEDIKDTLHKMLQMDTILSQNDTMIHWDLVEVIKELQKDKKDTFQINIAGDTIIVQPADVHFNPTIQGDTIIVNNDSLAGAIQALAEAMANIRGDSSGSYNDSALMAAIWGDTAGHSLGDTSGWGDSLGGLQGKIDSLGLGSGAYGDCDTTGGKTCDEQYIGKDGIATAAGKYKDLAKGLRDSVLENGPVHDSVQAWSNLFKSEKLSGGGSNACPTILTKTWSVDFKLTQVEIGPLGKYVCSPIMGNITPWQVGRTLLRALVAIACMWWLFRQAMGVSGGSDDDED